MMETNNIVSETGRLLDLYVKRIIFMRGLTLFKFLRISLCLIPRLHDEA